MNWYEKVESLAAKHGMKFLGSFADTNMHDIYALFDTPSMDTFMKFSMEPEVMAMGHFNKARVFPVMDHKSTLAVVKK